MIVGSYLKEYAEKECETIDGNMYELGGYDEACVMNPTVLFAVSVLGKRASGGIFSPVFLDTKSSRGRDGYHLD